MKKISEVRNMSGEVLVEAIKADNRETMCAALGTFIGAKSRAIDIVKKAHKYVEACDVWKQNWQTLIEYLAADVQKDLESETEKAIALLQKRNFTSEQIANALKQLERA